eukprot:1717282-Amphidinium_carterae.1
MCAVNEPHYYNMNPEMFNCCKSKKGKNSRKRIAFSFSPQFWHNNSLLLGQDEVTFSTKLSKQDLPINT